MYHSATIFRSHQMISTWSYVSNPISLTHATHPKQCRITYLNNLGETKF